MLPTRRARLCALALVAVGLGACASAPASVAGPPAGAVTAAPSVAGLSAPRGAGDAVADPSRPSTSAPRGGVPAGAAPRDPAVGTSVHAPAGFADPLAPAGVPFLPDAPADARPADEPAAEPAAEPAPGPVDESSGPRSAEGAPAVPLPAIPGLPGGSPLDLNPDPEPAPAAPGLSVPFGVYVAGGYSDAGIQYAAAMEMRPDGTYSMQPGTGPEMPDPAQGRTGTYRVVNGSALEFLTGPYAGAEAIVIPDYQATGRDFIDVTSAGAFTSFHFDHS